MLTIKEKLKHKREYQAETAGFYRKAINKADDEQKIEAILDDMLIDKTDFNLHEFNRVRQNAKRKLNNLKNGYYL